MPAVATGRLAEAAAAEFLQKQGYKPLELNFKTKLCEIDIVAEKDKRIYFVEVKYRRSTGQGNGLDYITDAKLRQMRFAAEVWISLHNWPGDYSLSAIEVSGPAFNITAFLPDCT